MIHLLDFLDTKGDKVELNCSMDFSKSVCRLVLCKEKGESFVSVLSKVNLQILIDELNKIKSSIPENPGDIIENMILSGKRMSDLDNEKLWSLYNSQETGTLLFACIQKEVMRRLGG